MAENAESSSIADPHQERETQLKTQSFEEEPETTTTTHHLSPPPGLTQLEFSLLVPYITEFHEYRVRIGQQCSSLLAQKIHAPHAVVWSVLRRFDKPQTYKHFIKNCTVHVAFNLTVGSTCDVNVISGLPAATSTERLDVIDDERHVIGFTIIGGKHRLRNYRSMTSVHALEGVREGDEWTVVLESYVVDVPPGNTEEDTCLFVDTVVKLNLQKLASLSVGLACDGSGGGGASGDGGAVENR